ncbi:unnamed protein product [Paramecium sonneborni]|uniref:Uncharacterized protein n=1 Tax=Paramecium sonneborni TaxID=65129 RepID=A0A8S1NU60_9CILI|nr:unnamed protein product [Paramecium sonneborni]
MDQHNHFKISRQIKRNKDINIKDSIFQYAEQLAQSYPTTYYSVKQINQPFQSVRKEDLKQLKEQYVFRLYRDISNRRYSMKNTGQSQKNTKIIMDYDFPLK